MSYYRTQILQSTHKRPSPLALGFVILLHVALITAIGNGLGGRVAKHFEPLSQISVIEPPPVTPPTPQNWVNPIIQTKPVVIPTDPSVPPIDAVEKGGITLTNSGKSVPEKSVTAKVVILPRLDPRHPVTQPPYPTTSRRAGEEGTVELMLYVLANGRIGETKIARSSGFSKLDDAAMQEALRSWRLLPQTVDGVAVATWHKIAVTFQLKN